MTVSVIMLTTITLWPAVYTHNHERAEEEVTC